MPTFQGQVERGADLLQLIAYIKSLSPQPATAAPAAPAPRQPQRRSRTSERHGHARHAPAAERRNYLNAGYGLASWLLTTDHKRIAILYLISITLFFFLGGAVRRG